MDKLCFKCKVKKDDSSFHKNKANKDGLSSHCKKCVSKKMKENYCKNPEKYKLKANNDRNKNPWRDKNNNLRKSAKRGGLTEEQLIKLRNTHSNLCDICGKICNTGRLLCVDHNHQTGTFRGFLCGRCNLSIGLFNDDILLLNKAINYLNKNL